MAEDMENRKQQEKILEIENLRKIRKRKTQKKQLVSLLLLGLFILLAFQFESIVTSLNISTFFDEMFSPGAGFPVALDGQEIKQLTTFRGNPAILSDSTLSAYSPSARSLLLLQHAYTQPATDIEYNRVLLFDRQGKDFSVHEENNRNYEKQTEYAILEGAISADGKSAIATLAKGYASKVTIYSAVGTQMYVWSSLDTYIMHMDFQNDNKGLVVSGVTAEGGQISTTVTALNFNSETATWKASFPGEVPVFTQFAPDGRILIATDKALRFLHADGTVAATYEYGSNILVGIQAQDTNTPVLLLKAYEGAIATTVVTVQGDGTSSGSFQVSDTIRDFEVADGKVYLLTSQGLQRYSMQGELTEWDTESISGGQQFCVSGGYLYLYASNRLVRIGA